MASSSPKGRRFVNPDIFRVMFDWRRPCDRCSWDGWLYSQLSREPQTNLLVCPPCLDKPQETREPNRRRMYARQKILD